MTEELEKPIYLDRSQTQIEVGGRLRPLVKRFAKYATDNSLRDVPERWTGKVHDLIGGDFGPIRVQFEIDGVTALADYEPHELQIIK